MSAAEFEKVLHTAKVCATIPDLSLNKTLKTQQLQASPTLGSVQSHWKTLSRSLARFSRPQFERTDFEGLYQVQCAQASVIKAREVPRLRRERVGALMADRNPPGS